MYSERMGGMFGERKRGEGGGGGGEVYIERERCTEREGGYKEERCMGRERGM